MKIGIGIIEYNRPKVFARCWQKMNEFLPPGARLAVVDDGSDVPVKEATFVHYKNKGIAAAKNTCLSLLDDCDHIFLFDSDCWPKTQGWWLPYINSGYNHLCFSFENNHAGKRLSHSVFVVEKKPDVWIYNAPNGCMLYLNKRCVQTVGGMDERFGIWSFEHVNYSQRIHNAGLTPYPFMDVPDSLKLFHSCDYYGEVVSSVPAFIRRAYASNNQRLHEQLIDSCEFIPYK